MKTFFVKYFFSLFLLCIVFNGYSQYSKVTAQDTIQKIYNKVFDFISSGVDTFSIHSFDIVKQSKHREVYFREIDSSEVTHKLEGTLQYLPYKRLFRQTFTNSTEIKINRSKPATKFTHLLTSMNPKNAQCYVIFYPILRYNDKIYLQLIANTPGVRNKEDETKVSTLNFIFNASLELIYFQGADIPRK